MISANNPNLILIKTEQLETGMYVQSVEKQIKGGSVKAQGIVKSANAIKSLKAKGVIEVIVDKSKSINNSYQSDTPIEAENNEPPKPAEVEPVSMAMEMKTAVKLHNQGKSLQRDLINAVQSGFPFDEQVPREFTTRMVGSIQRNPNALLCLTRIKEKNDYLLEHSLNVAILLANFASFLGLQQRVIEELAFAGFLHDIGKIKVDDSILNKPGKLSSDEMMEMQRHVEYGIETLSEAGVDSRLIRIVSEHHERLDGNGYPKGKLAADISDGGKMLSVVDIYDALTADRCYKKGMNSQQALKIMLELSPEGLDAKLTQHFIRCMGIYPVGSLVKLSNERLALVIKQNESAPILPVVKTFYSVTGGHFLENKVIDLNKDKSVKITEAVLASKYNINFNEYFDQSLLTDF